MGGPSRLAAAAFAVLLLATLGAFLLANRLKASEPEIEVLRRDRSFSPNGDGRNDTDTIVFRTKTSGRASVDVVDADGVRVRRLREDKRVRRGVSGRVTWDGRDDDGRRAPDGRYRLRLILDGGRALLAPRPFAVDTVAPTPTVTTAADTPIIRPGGTVAFSVRGAGPEEAPRFRVVRTDVTPARVVRTIPGAAGETDYEWDGRTDAGAVAPAGIYLIAVTAYDRARNAGQEPPLPLASPAPKPRGRPGVTVRALAVQPPVRAVRAGGLADLRVDARGRAFRWTLRRLGAGRPAAKGRRPAGRTDLLVRAPRGRSGLYLLRVETRSARTTVPIAVRGRARSGPLVVLPMVTWLGRDPVDTDGDGVPDVFGNGTGVRFPRLFAYPRGAPPGLYRQLAPLLRDLDERRVGYDLATDLDLAFTDAPTNTVKGVLMAGEPTWVSRELAARLRGYVRAGGHVALFGPRALRATASLGEGVLARPSPVTPVDALGGRLAPVRGTDATLSVLAEDDPALGLLEGFSGQLAGFDRTEALLSAGPGAKVTTSVGEQGPGLRPVLSAATLGKGLVIRVGLPGWGDRLAAGDDPVVQITANVVDLLRGAEPRPRTARG